MKNDNYVLKQSGMHSENMLRSSTSVMNVVVKTKGLKLNSIFIDL